MQQEKKGGVFALGFVLGMIFSYTGLAGFIIGALSGMVIAKEAPNGADAMVSKLVSAILSGINYAKHVIISQK